MIHLHILIGISVDIVATLLFTGVLFYRRHKRRDLFVVFTFFNLAMFVIVTLISSATQLGIGAGFGLFALLGIIRLRNEEFSNYEIAYFFGCLTLAIINGLIKNNYGLLAFMNAAIVVGMAILDHPLILRDSQNSVVTLDTIYDNDAEITRALESLLKAKILKFSVTKVDTVHDITTISVNYRKVPAQPTKTKLSER